jgi:hypothetical protein
MIPTRRTAFSLALALALTAPGVAQEISGYASFESRAFAAGPRFAGQEDGQVTSLVLEPELYREWDEGRHSFTVKPFLRYDSLDSERTHFDLRELWWRRSERGWELLVGVSKVFWGVTESQHLVDIVNQTDLVENPDGEDKLGQPMIRLSLIRGWGIVDLFVLPGFRERTFPGPEGRLRAALPISDDPIFESGAEERHVDLVARWSHALGPFDIGVSHFSGTSREPRLLPGRSANGETVLVPLYEQIDQTGLALQATTGSWLWKLEAINRSGQGERFAAATGGFEYTFWSAFGTRMDLGAVIEYLWDERGSGASAAFQDDLFAGSRLAFNDTRDTQILAGAIVDLESDGSLFVVEASRRIAPNWVAELEMRAFSGLPPTDPLASLGTEDYFQLSVQRHF